MPIITLLTDLGTADWYVGTLKGQLMRLIPGANVVDISHRVPKYDVPKAGFILRNTYPWFPEGTVHIVSVDASVNFDKPFVAIRFANQYFIGTDNGVFSLAFGHESLQAAVTLDGVEADWQSSLFQARDIFAKAAQRLLEGTPIEELGRPLPKLHEMFAFNPVYSEMGIQGNVLYADDFGNVITNIRKVEFEACTAGKPFSIQLRRERYNIRKIGRSYTSSAPGETVALFNSSGYLEIAIHGGSAHALLGLNIGDKITVLIHVVEENSTAGV